MTAAPIARAAAPHGAKEGAPLDVGEGDVEVPDDVLESGPAQPARGSLRAAAGAPKSPIGVIFDLHFYPLTDLIRG